MPAMPGNAGSEQPKREAVWCRPAIGAWGALRVGFSAPIFLGRGAGEVRPEGVQGAKWTDLVEI